MKTYQAAGITLDFPDSLFNLLDRAAAEAVYHQRATFDGMPED